nr:tRNA lysidine(34) synthetase TilS [uncultured Ruminococcus sp.]
MLNRVTATVEKYGLLEKGDSVIVALSGGADSTALLSVLTSLKEKYNLSVYAAHINHNIRGEEAMRDENFCKILCKKFNTELFVKSVDVPTLAKQQKISEELCGRNVRYAFFEELSQKLGAKVATAHTASDNAETLIFNIARGTSVAGLAAIPPKRGNIIRPLIELLRGDIESYCKANNLEYVTDSTNLADDYTRNYIRHNIMPCLKRLNPSFERTALGLSESARESADFIKKCSENALNDCKCDFGYDCKKLLKLDKAVLKEMLFILLKNNDYSSYPERKTILLLCEIIKNGGSVELSKQCTAVSKQGILRFVCSENSADFKEIPLKNNMTFSYDGKTYTVSKITEKSTNQNNLVAEKWLGENAVFRTRRAGDRFTYPDRMVTKPLRKIFNEQKIPSEMRDRLLLLAVSDTVLWCENLGVSLQGKADDTENLLIKMNKEG